MDVTLCGYSLEIKWFNLTLLLVPLILTLTFVFQDQKGIFYVPFICGICALIVFLNFPSIVIMLHSRPIYYDDLIMKNYEGEGYIYNEDFRKKYQKIFKWIVSVSSSIMVSFTVELWFFRDSMFNNQGQDSPSTSDKAVNAFVVLGIIGGLFRIYYGAAMLLGRLLLSLLKRLKKREQERLRQETEERTLVELTSIGVTIGGEDEEPLLQRSSSHDNIKKLQITGFKPTLMTDIFN
jgi:hypothetical protein